MRTVIGDIKTPFSRKGKPPLKEPQYAIIILWSLIITIAIPFALFLAFLSLTIYIPDRAFFKQYNNPTSLKMMIIAILTCGGSCLFLICYRFWVSRHWKSKAASSSGIDLGARPGSKGLDVFAGLGLGGGAGGGAGDGAGDGAGMDAGKSAGASKGTGLPGLPGLDMSLFTKSDGTKGKDKDKDEDPLAFMAALKPTSMV